MAASRNSIFCVAALVAFLVFATPCSAHSENGTFWLVAENTESPGARTADYVALPTANNATKIGDYTAFSQNFYAVRNRSVGDVGRNSREFYGHLTGVNTVVNAPTANTTTLWQSLVTLVFREGHYAGGSIVLSGEPVKPVSNVLCNGLKQSIAQIGAVNLDIDSDLKSVYYTSDITRQYAIIGGSGDFKYARGEAQANSTVQNTLPGLGPEYYVYVNYDVKH